MHHKIGSKSQAKMSHSWFLVNWVRYYDRRDATISKFKSITFSGVRLIIFYDFGMRLEPPIYSIISSASYNFLAISIPLFDVNFMVTPLVPFLSKSKKKVAVPLRNATEVFPWVSPCKFTLATLGRFKDDFIHLLGKCNWFSVHSSCQ